MLALMAIAQFADQIVLLFMEIFVFMETDSLSALAVYNAFYFGGVAIGFVIWGFIMAQLQISMRFNYLRSFAMYFLSFISLIFLPHDFNYLLVFAVLNGLGMGMFWIGHHSYEMIYTDSKTDRDFYSSMQQSAAQTITIASPLIATLTFIISEKVLHIETFKLLFYTLPFIYLLAIPFLWRMPDYIPKRISLKEIKELFFSKKLKRVRHYIASTSIAWPAYVVIAPIIAIAALNTVINVGFLQTAIGIISLIFVIFLSHIRHEGNRLKILFRGMLIYMVAYAILALWQLGPLPYVIASLIFVFNRPIYRVSEHLIDLHSIELMKDVEKNFYPGLLYRDMIIGSIRLTTIIAIGCFAYFTQNEILTIQLSIALIMLAIFSIWWSAKRMLEA